MVMAVYKVSANCDSSADADDSLVTKHKCSNGHLQDLAWLK